MVSGTRPSIPIGLIDYDVEPLAILGGPLYLGYREYIFADRKDFCRAIVSIYLALVYTLRPQEISTERYVREIYRERGLVMPSARVCHDNGIIREAAKRRYDRLHLPVLESIITRGYDPAIGPPITMTHHLGRYRVGDGKNRCSILAALGESQVPNVEVRE